MNDQLQKLVDRKRIVAIDAAPIPAPPNSRFPGNHLFVNCHYDVRCSTLPATLLLSLARGDAQEILKLLSSSPSVEDCVSVVVTVYGHFPAPVANRPARRRIYRVNLLCKDIPVDGSSISTELLSQANTEESSELDEVSELIHQATH